MYVVKKENIVFIALIFVIVCIAITCGYFAFQEEEVEHVELTDAVKIQEEYATYNEQVNENNNRTYPTVNLSDDNPSVRLPCCRALSLHLDQNRMNGLYLCE